jgi:hypothetical protein
MRGNCMPGVKDVVLASLFQDTSNDFILEETINLRTNSENKMETLTPPEFVEEFEKDFISYFEAILRDDTKISPNLAFFKKEVKNKTEIDLILKEHSYSKNSFVNSI